MLLVHGPLSACLLTLTSHLEAVGRMRFMQAPGDTLRLLAD